MLAFNFFCAIGKKQENPQTATTTPEEKEKDDTTEDEPLYKEKENDPETERISTPTPCTVYFKDSMEKAWKKLERNSHQAEDNLDINQYYEQRRSPKPPWKSQ